MKDLDARLAAIADDSLLYLSDGEMILRAQRSKFGVYVSKGVFAVARAKGGTSNLYEALLYVMVPILRAGGCVRGLLGYKEGVDAIRNFASVHKYGGPVVRVGPAHLRQHRYSMHESIDLGSEPPSLGGRSVLINSRPRAPSNAVSLPEIFAKQRAANAKIQKKNKKKKMQPLSCVAKT